MDIGGERLRKAHSVARCAKASMLLLSLKQSRDRNFLNSETNLSEEQEKVLMKRMIEDLKTSLTIERMERKKQRKKVKLFGMVAQIVLLLSIWSFFLVMAFHFY